MKYSLTVHRDTGGRAQVIDLDREGGIVYVYQHRALGSVAVFKFALSEVAEMRARGVTGQEQLRVSRPTYHVLSGVCSCDGYNYRGRCRHSEKVKQLGWNAHATE